MKAALEASKVRAQEMTDEQARLEAATNGANGRIAAQATALDDMVTAAGSQLSIYNANADMSLDQFAARLDEDVAKRDQWRANIKTVTERGGAEVGAALLAMGERGAGLADRLANATDKDFRRMAKSMVDNARNGGARAAWEMQQAMKIMTIASRGGAQATARAIADKLGIGVGDVAKIATEYGIALTGGINPILHALSMPDVVITAQMRKTNPYYANRAEGGVIDYYARGGLRENHVAEIAPAGQWRVWAEPETGGEAYIPLAPGKRDRSAEIWAETGRRLGIDFATYASGGFASAADVPRPASTAPYRAPISTAGDATMQRAYEAVTQFMKDNPSGAAGSGPLGGDWMSIYRAVHAAIPQARINSTYRAGDPGYHGRNKAIDFGFGSGPGGAGSAGLAAIARFLYTGYGKTLAELIYDGAGDNTPDVKNGRDHTYNAATRAEHHNHVHAAVYHDGTDYVPATGWAYLKRGEAVVPAEANARSREFSGATAPAAASARGLEGLRLVGTLDLGGGLEGRIDARVDQAFTGVANQLHYAGV
jgi:hypothetical protein